MKLVVLMSAIAVFLLFAAALSGVGAAMDRRERRLASIAGEKSDFGDEELGRSFSDRVLRPVYERFASVVRRTAGNGQNGRRASKSEQKLEKTLRSAGIGMSAQEFTFVKTGATFVLLGVCFLAMRFLPLELFPKLMLLSVVLAICIIAPKYWLASRVKTRKEAIIRDLPDVMDLLVVSVEAGLGLDAAITRLYEKDKGVVMQELMGTVRDVQMGLPRRVSMREMADRCGVKELTSFVTALIQAEQLGVSIKSVLISQADRLRTQRLQRVREKAQKAPVKMLLPMVGLIFPVLFIILLGPAVMNLVEVFSNGGLF